MKNPFTFFMGMLAALVGVALGIVSMIEINLGQGIVSAVLVFVGVIAAIKGV